MKKLSVEESKTTLHKMLDAEETFERHIPIGSKGISLTATPEFFNACALALEALEDIGDISTALYDATDEWENITWEIDMQTVDKAEKWRNKNHVTRKSIIKTQIEEIINGFDDPVSYDELIKVIREMKGDDT